MARRFIAIGLLVLGIYGPVSAADAPARPIIQTQDLREPVSEAIRMAQTSPQSKVLLVFDIDNTLLTMPQFLGSDRWFNHHAALITAGNDPEFASIEQLIATQAYLFGLGSMKLTQPDIPDLLADALKSGVQILLLTARGPDLSDATVRELTRNHFAWSAPAVCAYFFCSADGRYDADAVRHALQFIGSEPGSSAARPIRMAGGILFSAGQNKGLMLQLLTSVLQPESVAKVIFVDDGKRNVNAVASSQLAPPVAIYQYVRVPTGVTQSELALARKQLRRLRAAVCDAMATSLCPVADNLTRSSHGAAR